MSSSARLACRAVALVAAALLLSACETVFVKPLPAPAAKPDQRLLGRWVSESESDHGAYVQFDNGAGSELNISGLVSEPGDKTPVFTATTKRIGQYDFMCLSPTDEDKDKFFLVSRYAFDGDELTVWTLDQDKMNAAVTRRKLKGTVGQGVSDTVISDTPENVLKFLETAGGEMFKEMVRLRKSKEKPRAGGGIGARF